VTTWTLFKVARKKVQKTRRNTTIRTIVVNAVPLTNLTTARNAVVIQSADKESPNRLAVLKTWTLENFFFHETRTVGSNCNLDPE
jgi:hypothetical protein